MTSARPSFTDDRTREKAAEEWEQDSYLVMTWSWNSMEQPALLISYSWAVRRRSGMRFVTLIL